MKRVLVGGPLLGRDHHGRLRENNKKQPAWVSAAAASNNTTFEPIVTVVKGQTTPTTTGSGESSSSIKNKKDSHSHHHRLILLPTSRYVTVLSYKTGKRIATLLPGTTSEQDHNNANKKSNSSNDESGALLLMIESVALVQYSSKSKSTSTSSTVLLLVGLRDGTLREFDLDVLADPAELHALQSNKRVSRTSSGFIVPGPCLRPRRVLRVADKNQPILHLAASAGIKSTNNSDDGDDSVTNIVYAIVEEEEDKNSKERSDNDNDNNNNNNNKKTTNKNASLVRIIVPSMSSPATNNKKSPPKRNNNKRTTTTADLRNQIIVLDEKLKYSSSSSSSSFHEDTHHHKKYYAPFRLVASSPSGNSRRRGVSNSNNTKLAAHFVMIASPSSLCVYYDNNIIEGKTDKQPSSAESNSPCCVTFPAPSTTNLLSAFSVASNGKDVALGYVNGEIRIMDNLLSAVEDYYVAMAHYTAAAAATGKTSGIQQQPPKPKHPTENVVARRIHWHAHPVATLAYDSGSNDTTLYSGGEESVLVTWQLSRGSYKPAEVLPRVALGGIVHVLCVEQQQASSGAAAAAAAGILVYSDDNSLQLFESHNKSRVWKIQGSAAQQRTEILPSQSSVRLDHCPGRSSTSTSLNSNLLVFAGLPRAPGYIHSYDPVSQQVVSSLEVAPFNRISRTRQKDSPMPTPSITHAEWSGITGNVLVTVDVAATENDTVGSFQELTKKKGVGVVSTIRFWDRTEQQGPNKYELTAAMAYPHGTTHRVSALCLSSDGRNACTVSNDENAFRVWRREEEANDDSGAANQRNTSSWTCQYRVNTPAGFAKFPVGKDAVAFSLDSSILAIAYGNLITLWDYHDMTLVTSVHHVEDDDSAITKLEFLSTEQLPDMIFSVSSKGVALQSPYGASGPANEGWSFRLPYNDTETSHICCAIYLPTSDVVAIAIYDRKVNQSSITFVDATTGERYRQGTANAAVIVDGIPNKIVSISASSYEKPSASNWGEQVHERNNRPLRLYVLTSAGDVIYLDSHLEERFVPEKEDDVAVTTSIPRIPLLEEVQRRSLQQKRPLVAVTVDEIGVPLKKRLLVDDYFGGQAGSTVASSPELPRLSKAFARSFVGRHLQRQ